MVPRTFPSTYQTANGETRMVVFFLSSVSGLRKWVDYIPVKFTMLETQVNNSYNNNGVILVDPLSSTTNRQAWVDYVPVFVDANDTAAWRVDANGFIPVGFSTKPTLNLDFAGTKTLDSRVTFTRASNATYFDANGVLQTASNDVARFDHNPTTLQSLGLLIEEQRTNSIRNNTMQGAVAGTPGTLPTNWTGSTTVDGLNREIVGIGTQNGINYIDVRYSGTSSTGGSQVLITFDGVTQVAALQNQTWTPSVYLAVVGGTITNVSTLTIRHRYYNNLGSAITAQDTNVVSTISSQLTRFSGTAFTATDVNTAFTMFLLNADFVNSSTVDFTLRIGLPQLEQGAFATSAIPTTVAAATRNADVASMTGTNFSSWYNATEGTFFVNWLAGQDDVFINAFSAGSVNVNGGFINIRRGSSGNMAFAVIDGTATQAGLTVITGSPTAGTNYKAATAFKINDFAATSNGATPGTDTSGTVPSTIGTLVIGNGWNNSGSSIANEYLNGHIQRIAYYPVRLSNDQLQALTR